MADETIEDGDSAAAKSVAADITNSHRRETVTDEQRLLWRLEFEAREEERQQRVREARIENHRAEIAAAAQAERQAAIAAELARQKASREFRERGRERDHQRTVYEKLVAAERFRNEAVAAARRQAVIQQRQALLDDLDRTINPPAPEAPVIIVEQQSEGSAELGSADFDPTLFARKPRSWW